MLVVGEQVFGGAAGLIVEKRNRVVSLRALDREITAHDLEGNVAAGVGGVVVATPDALQSADDFEAMAIEENERAHGGTSRKKVACHLIAEDDDVAFLTFVETVEPAPQFQREEADSVVLRFGSGELATGAGKLAHGMYFVGDEYRSDGLNVRRLFANVEIILVREPILASGGRSALKGRTSVRGEDPCGFALLRGAAPCA